MSDNDLHDFCLRYLDGSLNEEEMQSFYRLIAGSEEAAQHLARYAIHERLFHAALQAYKNKGVDQYRANLFADLLRMERDAPLNMVVPSKPTVHHKRFAESSAPSLRQATGLAAWALAHSIRSMPASWLLTAAAVLLISAIVVWQSTITGPTPQQQTPGPLAGQLQGPHHVARLTVERGAQWERGSIAPGTALYPGDRLTLIDGYAQIETAQGAVAVFEAPATVELFDHDNAIRLLAGKLVGKCETELSQGFVVHTPYAEVVDLGTVFTVTIDAARHETAVMVHDGKVQVTPTPRGATSRPAQSIVSEGEAVAVSVETGLRQTAYISDGLAQAVLGNRYEPAAAGRPVAFEPGSPTDFRKGKRTSDKLQVYLEGTGVQLDKDVAVDLVGEDRWPEVMGQPPRLIKAGQRVDVYLLHMDKTGIEAEDFVYTLDFGRPILGVIATQEHLKQTDRLTDLPGRQFDDAPDAEGKLLRGIEVPDSAQLSADGQSLQVQMLVEHKTDQVRVLVKSLRNHD